jgi:hypothetical protein
MYGSSLKIWSLKTNFLVVREGAEKNKIKGEGAGRADLREESGKGWERRREEEKKKKKEEEKRK